MHDTPASAARAAARRRSRGTTRTVWTVHRWAVKVPSTRRIEPHRTTRVHAFARGWCANLSEWHHRDTPGVCAARWTVLGLVQVYPRAEVDRPGPTWAPIPPAELHPAPTGLTVDRTWANVGRVAGAPVWIDYDQTDQNR